MGREVDNLDRILIIEDDGDLQEGLSYSLGAEGYQTDTASGVGEGKKKLAAHSYGLLLLDCNLPDGNGFELCRELRKTSDVLILMLTARDTEIDEVKALEMGADDYMSKPFSVAVLKAMIKKLLSRKGDGQWVASNGIRIDKKSCCVYRGDEEITLSKVEYKLLLYFMENKGLILSKEQILEHIWDSEGKFVDENIVSVNIRRIRSKVESDPQEPKYIKTVYGLGYIWKEL